MMTWCPAVRPTVKPRLTTSLPRPAACARRRRLSRLTMVLMASVMIDPALSALVPGTAFAVDEAAALDTITKLNKKALEEYDNLSFDLARKTLEEALDLCTKNGLDKHPLKARTHIHLGVVLLAMGSAQRNDAVKEFQKAVAIQPDIKPSERVANPEVQSAFNEAKASAGRPAAGAAPVTPPPTVAGKPAKAAPPARPATPAAPPAEPAPATEGLAHDAVRTAAQGTVIPISVTTDPSLNAKKVALWFRPDGAPKFVSIDLREYTPGNWSGSIPETATEGEQVSYFISAENGEGEVVGSHGASSAPLVIDLKGEPAVAQKKSEPEEPGEDTAPSAPREELTWYLALAAGSGLGYVTGKGDINNQDTVSSGFERSQLGHLLPEVGYFVDNTMIISLQLRLQYVSGATSVPDLSGRMCGTDHICEPATGAVAALARLTWLLGEDTFVPYLSAVVGAGQVRHLAHFPKTFNCSSDPAKPLACVDTVTSGPILLGPGAGFIVHVTDGVGLNLGLATLVGFPQFTFHVDLNAGFVVEL